MQERQIDAFIIPGNEGPNAARDYLTGGVKASALVVKKRGQAPILIVNHMEVEEAHKSGLLVMSYDEFNAMEIAQKYGRGTVKAKAALWEAIFTKLEIRGRLTFYGASDMQSALRLLILLASRDDLGIEIAQDESPDMLEVAAQTKDAQELAQLRESGHKASAVMRQTRAWLGQHRIQGEQIVNAEGQPLTIGAVKRFVRVKLLEADMEDPEGHMIFAQGRDAGLPHSRGEDDAILRPGQAIVFDLFPRPLGGGQHHDMTRTWCLGYAPPEVQHDYQTVMDVFWRSLEGIEIGQPTRRLAIQVCEWFEAAGHPSRLSTPTTTNGYVHSLGHGLGLSIHEDPSISHHSPEHIIFQAGNVVTIEPGLYYPDKGYGIRIEDTVYLDENGQIHNFTDCPYDLVIPLQGS
jgi:Xaa-Pro aminopeptidase